VEGIRRSCKLDEPEERGGTRMSTITKKQFRKIAREELGNLQIAEIC
jgi:hypothetical protein